MSASSIISSRRLALIQIWAVFRKEVMQTVRDRRIMFMLIMAPTLQSIIFGFAVDFTVDRVPTVVVDLDQSEQSREHIRRLLADGTLSYLATTYSVLQAEQIIDNDKAAVAIVIPKSFGRAILAGKTTAAQVIVDGSDPNRSTVAGMAVQRYFGEVSLKLLRDRIPAQLLAKQMLITAKQRVWYNPRQLSPVYMIPGILTMLLTVATTIVLSMGLAREREMGTLEQVLVTPIRPIYLLLGKLIPFFIIGFIDLLLILTLGTWLFSVPIRGSLVVIVLSTTLFLLSTLGVGLFVSTISSTQQQAFLGGFLFIMPAVLLAGVMTPIRAMPNWLQYITYINPLRHYAHVMRACMIKGATIIDLAEPLIVLLLFGIGILGAATLRFKKAH
ncbi:MAG: ABC transporter permease [Deltaproteobacteria bacterium]|nr:ABC transporter permease [Deltaproteobacteria bacterium]